jgi:hypothetical protein
MNTYEIITLIISSLSLILGAVANIRINNSNNKTGDLNQGGDHNLQAGRDINK